MRFRRRESIEGKGRLGEELGTKFGRKEKDLAETRMDLHKILLSGDY